MNQERIKIDGILLDTIKKNRKMIREDSSLPTNEDILKLFGIENEKDIEANDYFQFYKCFGNNVQLYKTLKPHKEKAEVSWQDIKNIKWGDIDLNKGTVIFRKEVISR